MVGASLTSEVSSSQESAGLPPSSDTATTFTSRTPWTFERKPDSLIGGAVAADSPLDEPWTHDSPIIRNNRQTLLAEGAMRTMMGTPGDLVRPTCMAAKPHNTS